MIKNLLSVMFFFTFSALAAAGGWSLGGGAGVVFTGDENIGSPFWVTGNARFTPKKHFAVEAEVGYWQKSATQTICFFGCSTETATLSDLNAGGSALFVSPHAKVDWWIGGGLALHHEHGHAGFFGFSTENHNALGVQLRYAL
jgi:hypothetical protein